MGAKPNKIHSLEDRKSFWIMPWDLGNMGLLLSKMPSIRRIRGELSSFFKRLSKMRGKEDDTVLEQEDTELEASHRRHDIRGSVEAFTKRIWDAIQKPQGMEVLLRKHSLRTRKDDEIQRREEETNKRIVRLARLSKTEGWQIDIVSMLRSWENFCYMNLRFPETRKDKVSLDNFIGFQNGALWIIESLRKEVYNAVNSLKKQNAIQNQKNRE